MGFLVCEYFRTKIIARLAGAIVVDPFIWGLICFVWVQLRIGRGCVVRGKV